jgi:inorganic triphosphatase YgiF
MNATEARTQLLAHHDRLRQELEICTGLARRVRLGEEVTLELDAALAQLRADFAEHNEAETAVIRKLLHRSSGWGTLLIDRMLEEHTGEHAAFWELLSGTRREMIARIEDLADQLDAHMAAEERTFLSPGTLRDDVIAQRTSAC